MAGPIGTAVLEETVNLRSRFGAMAYSILYRICRCIGADPGRHEGQRSQNNPHPTV